MRTTQYHSHTMTYRHLASALTLICLFTLGGLTTSLQASGLIVLTHEVESSGKRRPVHPWWHWHHPPHHHPPVIIPPRPPRPWPRPIPHRVLPLTIRKHSVNTQITGQVAVTTIEQVFYNPNQRRLEGEFWLPLNPGVHLDKFSMNVNGHMQEAELLDAGKARKIYEDIVRSQKDPALLEFDGQGLLKCRIFPIEPRSTQRIELVLTQVLTQRQSLIEYSLPLSPLKYAGKTIGELSIDIRVDNNKTLKNIYSPSHKMRVTRPSDKAASLHYSQKDIAPASDFKLFIGVNTGSEVSPLVGLDFLAQPELQIGKGQQKQAAQGHFLLLGSPIKDMRKEKSYVPKDIVFVLDTSGSMAKNGKLDQAKNAMEFCLRNLHSEDRFELIRFSTEAQALHGELSPVNKKSVEQAIQFVNQLRPIGGTAINDALASALKLRKDTAKNNRPFVVIFLTDGKPTIGETDEVKIVSMVNKLRAPSKSKDSRSRIFCFGIGTKINTRLLDRISEDAGGHSQYVLPKEDIEVAVSHFYNRIKNPLLTNLSLKIRKKDSNILLGDFYPRQLPDLYEGDQLQLLGRYEGSGEIELILTGDSSEGRQTFSTMVSLPEDNKAPKQLSQDDFIAGLWATRRVGYLLDQVRLNGESEELKKEITRLARTYGIVTPYTAYLIVEDEARRNVPITRRNFQQLQNESWRGTLKESATNYGSAISGEDAVNNAQISRSLRDSKKDYKLKSLRLKKEKGLQDSSQAPALRSFTSGYGKASEKSLTNKTDGDKDDKDNAYVISRRLRGRTFYQNGKTWVDSRLQKNTNLKIKRIAFASEAYFKLMREYPEVKQWLSLGIEVQFVHEDAIYEVYDEK